jgi:hypothetical protein
LANLFTKSLPLATFDKCVKHIGMRRFKNLQGSKGYSLWIESSVFLIRAEKTITCFIGITSCMTSSTIQGGVLQIQLKYKFELQFQMAS